MIKRNDLTEQLNRKGFTLLELMLTSLLGGVVVAAMGYFMFYNTAYYTSLRKNIEGGTDNLVAVKHMVNVLRFAKPDTIELQDVGEDEGGSGITATIEGGCVSFLPGPADIKIKYSLFTRPGDTRPSVLFSIIDKDTEEVLSEQYLTFNDVLKMKFWKYDFTDPLSVIIQLRTNRGGNYRFVLRTMVACLGS